MDSEEKLRTDTALPSKAELRTDPAQAYEHRGDQNPKDKLRPHTGADGGGRQTIRTPTRRKAQDAYADPEKLNGEQTPEQKKECQTDAHSAKMRIGPTFQPSSAEKGPLTELELRTEPPTKKC